MRNLILTLMAALAPALAAANDAPPLGAIFLEETQPLENFQWTHRPIVVFADAPNDPRFVLQMERLRERPGALAERDVVIMTDTDRDSGSELRTKLRPRGFMLVLIGKDGQVKLRKPAPWDVREITRVIDKMPMRQQELRERRSAPEG